jgi:thymidylate kinase
MANLIFIEGVSRTGKSSLTEELSSRYGFKFISIKDKMPSNVNSDKLPVYYHGMHIMANNFYKTFPDETFVLDRSFLSEIVYSKFFNRDSYINCDDIISDLLFEHNFVLINLSGTFHTYMERSPKDRIVYNENEYIKQKDLFSWYFEKYKNNEKDSNWSKRFLELDTAENSIPECYSKIREILIKNQIIKND